MIPDLLESVYQESAVPLPGSALHNQHINYYSHWDDGGHTDDDTDDEGHTDDEDDTNDEGHTDDEDDTNDEDRKRPRDTTPVFTPSKLYLFDQMQGRCDTWTQNT